MSHSHIRVISGNFSPPPHRRGRRGQHTGQVRKIDVDALKFAIEKGSSVVLLSPLLRPRATPSTWRWKTWPPAGVALRAEKLIFLSSSQGVLNDDGTPDTELARGRRRAGRRHAGRGNQLLPAIRLAGGQARRGRSHLLPSLDGSVLLEIFTHDGVGTMVEDTLDDLRPAPRRRRRHPEPIEAGSRRHAGARRSVIERDVENFTVLERRRDLGCATLHNFAESRWRDGCLIVHPECRARAKARSCCATWNRAARPRQAPVRADHAHLALVHQARLRAGGIADLPREKQHNYNRSRNSLVFIKKL